MALRKGAGHRGALGYMKFLDVRPSTLGMVDCLVQRVSFTGDLGYETFCDPMAQRALWAVLWQAGHDHGMRQFGMRAIMSRRLDRFFGAWMHEFPPPDYFPRRDRDGPVHRVDQDHRFHRSRGGGGRARQRGRAPAFRVERDQVESLGVTPGLLHADCREKEVGMDGQTVFF